MYEYPIDDPMFSAHVSALSQLIALGGNTSIAEFDNWYTADAPTVPDLQRADRGLLRSAGYSSMD